MEAAERQRLAIERWRRLVEAEGTVVPILIVETHVPLFEKHVVLCLSSRDAENQFSRFDCRPSDVTMKASAERERWHGRGSRRGDRPGTHLPWAKNPPFQRLHPVRSAFNVFNNLGNLLSLKAYPKQVNAWGFGTVLRQAAASQAVSASSASPRRAHRSSIVGADYSPESPHTGQLTLGWRLIGVSREVARERRVGCEGSRPTWCSFGDPERDAATRCDECVFSPPEA